MRPLFSQKQHYDVLIGIGLVATLALVPLLDVNRYIIGQIILFMIYGSVAMHWNLLFGYAGIFSLAQLMVFGLGAYGMAMLNFYLGLSIWWAIPISALLTMVFSLTLGLATLRLNGVYTALLTLAFAQVVTVLILTDTDCFLKTATSCRPFTGGAGGFYGFDDFNTRAMYKKHWITANYYIILAAASATVFATFVLIHSGFGIALRAMRDNPKYAQALGVNKFTLHLKVFAVTAFLTGLMGAFYAGHIRTVSPTVMSLSQMLYLIAAVVVGGAGRGWGPLVGLATLMLADEVLRDYGNLRQIGIGVMLMLVPLFFRGGILGFKWPTRKASNL